MLLKFWGNGRRDSPENEEGLGGNDEELGGNYSFQLTKKQILLDVSGILYGYCFSLLLLIFLPSSHTD